TAGDAPKCEKHDRPEMEWDGLPGWGSGHGHSASMLKFRLSAVNLPLERASHQVNRRAHSGPGFQGERALIKQHAQSVGGAATGRSGGLQQGRLRGAINHVENQARL